MVTTRPVAATGFGAGFVIDERQWKDVERIFHALLAHPVKERPRLLKEATEDEEVRKEVAALLEADDPSFLPPGEPLGLGMPEVVAGASIGGYVLEAVLGRGGMGVVYRARDPRLDRPVAIKLLGEFQVSPGFEPTLLRNEARLLARCNHPNIATIHAIETDERNRPFLVLEFVPGQTLAERIARGPSGMHESASLLIQVADGLIAAHSLGVVHGDLKPENIIVNESGAAKILDFGLARELGGGAAAGRPLWGTPAYMSPERWAGADLETSGDVFAFGCVVFECLTGERAIPGERPEDIRAALGGVQARLDLLPAAVPEDLRGCIGESLERDPARRPSMERWRTCLAELESGGETPERTPVTKLPAFASSFVGRDRELDAMTEHLSQTRLLTLTGPGGSGKTRLAVEWARLQESATEFAAFVDLSGVDDDARVPDAVRIALGLQERRRVEPSDAVVRAIGERRGLLMLDNCERVTRGCAALADEILLHCSHVHVIATSREPLGLSAETCYRVPPLSFEEAEAEDEDEGGRIVTARLEETSGAARLFIDRARSSSDHIVLDEAASEDIRAIVRKLEGIPLAIELVAARTRVMTLSQIRDRLERQLDVVGRGKSGSSRRQETLWSTFRWSYEMLSSSEQRLLRRLSTFAGGWDLAAAERVGACDPEIAQDDVLLLLTALVEKSLVRHMLIHPTTGRYRMLEIERQFAEQELRDSGEEAASRDDHLRYWVRVVGEAGPALIGEDQSAWLSRIALEHENLTAALRFALDQAEAASTSDEIRRRSLESALRICIGVFRYWILRSLVGTGLAYTSRALDCAARVDVEPAVLAEAHFACGVLAAEWDQHARARAHFEQSLAVKESLGLGGEAELRHLGLSATRTGQHDDAREWFARAREESRRRGNQRAELRVMVDLANAAVTEGDLEAARSGYLEVLSDAPVALSDWERAVLYGNCSYVGHHLGIFDESLRYALQALEVAESASLVGEEARAKINAGRALHLRGRLEESLEFLRTAVEETRKGHTPFYQTFALNYLMAGLLDQTESGDEELESFYVESLRLASEADLKHAEITALSLGARIALRRHEPREALDRSARAVRLLDESGTTEAIPEEILHYHAVILRAGGDREAAVRYDQRASAVMEHKALRIQDPQLRTAFYGVPINRAIAAALQP